MRSRTLTLIAATVSAGLALSACGANSSGSGNSGDGTSSASAPAGGGASGKVGVILPETATSARWEAFDKPMLQAALSAQGFSADIQNAQGDNQKFSTLADGFISSGVKVLIIAPSDPAVGAAIEAKAKNAGIPVIDYDRPSLGGSADYYVSFDNEKVGEIQAQGLADALKSKPGANVVQIEGAPTDNNATLFANGHDKVLKPLYDSKALNLVQKQAIDNWDAQVGGTTFEQIFTRVNGKVDGVVAANDELAGAVITVLKKNGLNGKVPVTGQDATAAGLQAILRGDQTLTIFKPIKEEAENTAKLAAALAKNDKAGADAIATGKLHDPKNNRDLKSVLLQPQLITIKDIKTVVQQGYVKASDICTGDLAAKCTENGIS
ncbi:sugar ABC transporter substrate-binding protein [Amycolatopsis rubida]|uniref:D-xylose transport system substrate-binding protein n=1 Tax=Amycolatopsis rubida TaxID=112413 RepID=A0A1I5QTQ5_9PSEU|nr:MULTISPECIES: substrate-binding domain-containing protein [Amycolatopsis]MYW94907.1 substrate-binding domain-containing protein [Amycolatopsis rubida]MYW95873.1 substrate-binding domain-containing protein [Amycolatopsis rubida]NEC59894.1 sugar ABC transporter substrate-binding protein [Amycolatopsis rubida]NEC60863.1 sugar ABC transporter substrate-binding protein [Amycolatopsis rubida]OAP26666.1 D-xylose-binding periplasmic protein precursor [Amycolatopsis sp. M39]